MFSSLSTLSLLGYIIVSSKNAASVKVVISWFISGMHTLQRTDPRHYIMVSAPSYSLLWAVIFCPCFCATFYKVGNYSRHALCPVFTGSGKIGTAFAMNFKWSAEGQMGVGTLCTVQGAVSEVGDLGAAIWSLAISFHTFSWVPSYQIGLTITEPIIFFCLDSFFWFTNLIL